MSSTAAQPGNYPRSEHYDESPLISESVLPAKQIIRPDENGIKKVIEYKFNEMGLIVKTTSTIHVRKFEVSHRRSNRAEERRSWPKFGDAAVKDHVTRFSCVEVFFTIPAGSKKDDDEPKIQADLLEGKPWTVHMLCTICHTVGDHWAARCPGKELAIQHEHNRRRCCCEYRLEHHLYLCTLKVTNLSKHIKDYDLAEVFDYFGPISWARVEIDLRTRKSEGYGFVAFKNRVDAERAIKSFNESATI